MRHVSIKSVPPHTRRITWLALASVLLLLLAACVPAPAPPAPTNAPVAPTAAPTTPVAKPTEAPKPAAAPTTAPATAPTAVQVAKPTSPVAPAPVVAKDGAMPKVTIFSGGLTLNHAPQMVASKRGFFLEEGLDAEYAISSQGASVVVAAVLSGEALLGCTGGPAAISPISKNAPIKIVIVVGSRYAAEITLSQKFLQAKGVTPQSPLEQKVKALKGARLGIYSPGDSTDQLARYLFKRYGINVDTDVELVSTQNAPNMLAAFRRGSIDGIMVSPPTGVQAESEGLGQIFIRGEDEPTLKGYPYAVCFASVVDIEQRPQVVASAVAALARSARLLRTEPEQVKADVRSFFPEFDPKIFGAAYASAVGAIPESVVPTSEGLRVLQDFSRAQGAEITYSFEQAMDPRPAQQALKKLGW